MKNIPLPSEDQYKMELMNKIEIFVKRMRWRAFYFDNESDPDERIQDTYGLKSANCPPPIKDLTEFEKELFDLVNKVKFRNVECKFQKEMQSDLQRIKKSGDVFVAADKTSNIYKVKVDDYKRMLHGAVTKSYKKANDAIPEKVTKEGKSIATEFKVLDKMNLNCKNECFITLKDHKDNFINNPTTRLINPSKNEIGRISKRVLEKLNSKLREETKVHQWKNTNEVIKWFNGLEQKSSGKFMVFDVKDFYPSITEELLELSLDFASKFVPIKSSDLKAIRHARKWLLFRDSEPWVKRNNNDFDVSMGAYDGAEVCELVGIFLLNTIAEDFNKNFIGLYRDDGLA
ncbi:MAG: hypothetical protein AAGK05_17460, partial [Pseudomonadota bacterium]